LNSPNTPSVSHCLWKSVSINLRLLSITVYSQHSTVYRRMIAIYIYIYIYIYLHATFVRVGSSKCYILRVCVFSLRYPAYNVKKVKFSRYRPNWPTGWIEVLLYPFLTSALEGGGWSAPRPSRFIPGKDPVPIVQEAGWAPGPVWTCAKNLAPTGIYFVMLRSPDRPARSQSLYRQSYRALALLSTTYIRAFTSDITT
jgi:hypothetical protein